MRAQRAEVATRIRRRPHRPARQQSPRPHHQVSDVTSKASHKEYVFYF